MADDLCTCPALPIAHHPGWHGHHIATQPEEIPS